VEEVIQRPFIGGVGDDDDRAAIIPGGEVAQEAARRRISSLRAPRLRLLCQLRASYP